MLVNIKCWCFNPGYLSTKQKCKTSLPYLGTYEVISDVQMECYYAFNLPAYITRVKILFLN